MSPATRRAWKTSRCDFWEATLPNAAPNNLWYRFIVTDGTDTDYYADNTPALDGGLGSVSDNVVDNSYALIVYDPSFVAPNWAANAVIYQIFPDRFRNGRSNNDPKTGDVRYDDPVLRLAWGTLPEGYCRNYADGCHQLSLAVRHQPAILESDQRSAARARLHGRRPPRRGPEPGLPPIPGCQYDLLQPDLRCRRLITATIPRITTRSTPTLALRKIGKTWSGTPTNEGCVSSWTAYSTTSRRTARSSTVTITIRMSAPVKVACLALPELVHLPRCRTGHGSLCGQQRHAELCHL